MIISDDCGLEVNLFEIVNIPNFKTRINWSGEPNCSIRISVKLT